MNNDTITLLATGDNIPSREDYDSLYQHVAPLLRDELRRLVEQEIDGKPRECESRQAYEDGMPEKTSALHSPIIALAAANCEDRSIFLLPST